MLKEQQSIAAAAETKCIEVHLVVGIFNGDNSNAYYVYLGHIPSSKFIERVS